LPLYNWLLLNTIERINSYINNFSKFYKNRDLEDPDFEKKLYFIENNLKKLEFSDSDIKLLRLDIINELLENLSFIGAYKWFDFSEYNNIFSPYDTKTIRNLIKNFFKKSKESIIQDIYFEIEEKICKKLQKLYLNKKQMNYLLIMIHNFYLSTNKWVLI